MIGKRRHACRSVVRRSEVNDGSARYYAGGIDLAMRHIVVALDVVEIDSLGDARRLVQVAGVGPQVGVVDQATLVALEVANVNGVEADEVTLACRL